MARIPSLPSPNMIDRIVGYVSPLAGVNRMKARAAMAIAGQWVGARTDRRPTFNWLPATGSADADDLYDLGMLRSRSRDLQRTNPIALGAVNTNVTSIVGTGLSLRSRIDYETIGISTEDALTWQRAAEREFRLWAEDAVACDSEATSSFYSLQALAIRSALDSGDVGAALPMVRRRSSMYDTKVLLIEADRICNKDGQRDTESLSGGVQKDKYGAPVAYHVLRKHPYGLEWSKKEWDVIPAFGSRTGRRNFIHLFDKRRPGKTRGTPYLAPVMESLKQMGQYTDAELQAAVVSAFFTVFVKTESGDGIGMDSNGAAPSSTPASGDAIKLAPAAIVDLAAGEDIVTADPKRPNLAFDGFMQAMARHIGVALELPNEVLLKSFTSSYSAARAALLEAWRFFKCRRAWLAEMFCQPIYEAWLEEAVAKGYVIADGFFDDPRIRKAYCGAEWIGDGPGQIDPLKEISAAKARIDARLSTHQRETAELTGADWRDENATLGRELKEQRDNGTLAPDMVPAAIDQNADTNTQTNGGPSAP